MKLYYSQGACSLAPHIALHEADLAYTLEPVNLKTKTIREGDYTKVNPKGYVPALKLDNGELLTEVAVILQYIADLKPDARLFPKAGTPERWKALEWLNFVATEIHKGFGPLWNPSMPAEGKEMAKATLGKKFGYISERLSGNFLLGQQYSIVDCYLFTVLNWSPMVGVDLSPWPELGRYIERVRNRPAVQAAMKSEGLIK
jgi:glutathione S-transferase